MSEHSSGDVERWIHANEPVTKSEIRDQFGQDGLKRLASLLEKDAVFEGEGGEYWSVGTESEHR